MFRLINNIATIITWDKSLIIGELTLLVSDITPIKKIKKIKFI